MSIAHRARKEKTLDELREEIEELAPTIDVKPYSHNIVGLCLLQISQRYGPDEVNRAIVDFDLKAKGWTQPQ